MAAFIAGERSIDEFDDFVEEVKSLDVDRAIEIKQAALDRYNTALGEHITQLEAKQAAVERANGIEQKGYDLLIQQARAEEELATLKGDTEAATRAQTDATDLQNEKAAAAIAQRQRGRT